MYIKLFNPSANKFWGGQSLFFRSAGITELEGHKL